MKWLSVCYNVQGQDIMTHSSGDGFSMEVVLKKRVFSLDRDCGERHAAAASIMVRVSRAFAAREDTH